MILCGHSKNLPRVGNEPRGNSPPSPGCSHIFKSRWAICLSLASSPLWGKCRLLLQQQALVPWNRTFVSGPWVFALLSGFCGHDGLVQRATPLIRWPVPLLWRKTFYSMDMEIPCRQCQPLLAGGMVSLDAAAPVHQPRVPQATAATASSEANI